MLLLCVILLAHSVVVIGAHASPADTIHIAIAKNIPPYSFVDDQGEVKGLLIDYWQLWGQKVNKNIKFVAVNWQDPIPALKASRIDIHFGLLDAKDLHSNAARVFPFYKAATLIYIKKDSNIEKLSDLNGRRIGAINIPVYRNYLKKNFPQASDVGFNSFGELFLAAEKNEIDAFLNEAVISWHQLVEQYKYHEFKTIEDSQVINFFYAITGANNLEMKDLIQRGMAKISEQELIDIEQQWIFNEPLQLLSKIHKHSVLTEQEKEWLLQHPNIQIGSVSQWAPFVLRDNFHNYIGINVDLIELINRNLATDFQLKFYENWGDAVDDVANDRLDGVLSLSKTAKRQRNIDFSPSYFYTAYDLVVNDKNNEIHRFDDLAGQRVAVFNDHVITEKIAAEIAVSKFVYIKNREQAYQLLQDNQADVAIFSHPEPDQMAKYNLKVAGSIESDAGKLHIGTRKSMPMLGQIITKGINSITSQQRSKLFDKWIKSFNKQSMFTLAEHRYLANKPSITVGIESWPPIIFSDDGQTIKGIAGELLAKVVTISGLSLKIKTGAWAELLAEFKLGKIDLLPTAFFDPERAKFGSFSEDYLELSSSLFTLEQMININSFDDLAGLKLAIVKGDILVEKVKALYPEIEIVLTTATKNSISRLLSGEVAAIFGIEPVIISQLKNSLMTGVKVIRQTNILPLQLHFLSHKNKPLLSSILDKALASISESQRFDIFEHWIGQLETKKSLNIALGLGREPYVIDKNAIKGIEHDLIKQAFAMSDIDIVATHKLTVPELDHALDNFLSVDAAANVAADQSKGNYFYADKFISFNNVVITSKASKLTINSLLDLRKYSVLAFDGAYQYLGHEYLALFNPQVRPDTYRESVYQEQQFNDLLTGAVDAVVLDKTIFQWFAAKAGYADSDLFTFHHIFPDPVELGVNFRDKQIRDIFRHNLAVLKASGQYQHIIDGYTTGHIVKKIEFSSIVAALAAESILLEDQSLLQPILDLLTTLPYIRKIEAFNNNDKLLYRSSSQVVQFYQQRDSVNLFSGVEIKAGYVRVYFDEEQVRQQLLQDKLIPEIAFYKALPQYQSVWEVYRRFNFLEKQIKFSAQEKNYLLSPPVLSFSEVNWQPLAIVKAEKVSGIIADYLALIAEKTGIEFEFVPQTSWNEAVKAFEQNEIDLLPGVDAGFYVNQQSEASNSYAKFRLAVVMDKNASYIDDLKNLKGKTIALPKGFVSSKHIKTNYPDVLIIPTENVSEALTLVRKGTADAFVGHLAIAAFQLEHHFNDLNIVGQLDYEISHSILLKQGQPLLISILNKAIASITPNQHRTIRNRWLSNKTEALIDYQLIYQLIFVFCIILLLILLVFKKLSKAKRLIEQSHVQLEESISELKQAQQQLVETEKMASLGGLVAGIAHEINTPVGIGLTAITHFSHLSHSITQKYQQNKMTKQAFDDFLAATSESAGIINRNLERTADLVKSFKQISVDQSSDERRTFNVNNYVDEILLSINHVTKKSQVNITLECEESLVINSYPGAFSQILSNLILNSTIHGYPNNEAGDILINISQQDDTITLIYHDDGKGISSEDLPKIFHPFFTTNRDHGGSGLGLNIIYNIVTNRLMGTIICNSEQGGGVEFIIRFEVE